MAASESPHPVSSTTSRPVWAHTLAEERALMNAYAPDYRASMLFSSYYYEEERRRFVDLIWERLVRAGRDPRALSYLDVGSGTGEIVELLSERGCRRLTGLDIAERMHNEAASLGVDGLELVRGSVESHGFGTGTFDVVVAALTVHHLYDPRAFFVLVDHVLRAGGWFFILDYNAASWTYSGWTRWPIRVLSAPLRKLFKLKNRRSLSARPGLPARFNPTHRLLRHEEFVAAMPHPGNYDLRIDTRGVFLPAFSYALIRESPIDRVLHRVLRAVDAVAKPFRRGSMMVLAGERRTTRPSR